MPAAERPAAQHRAVLADPLSMPTAWRPTPGPIAILPDTADSARFRAAAEVAGAAVQPISPTVRAVVWLAHDDPEGLDSVLAANPQLQWLQLPWAGVDAFTGVLERRARADLMVTSAKGAYAQPVAEHALTLILALLRELPTRVRAGSWGSKSGTSLFGLSVLIVGAGGIAVELMRLLQPFEVEVTVLRRRPLPVAGAARTVALEDLLATLPMADVVVLAAASTAATRGLIGEAQLAAMKPSAILVNVARGTLIDTDALDRALAAGALAGAALDGTDPEPLPDAHPLWRQRRCLITPHTADTPAMIAPLLAERLRANVAAYLGDGAFVGVVDPVHGY